MSTDFILQTLYYTTFVLFVFFGLLQLILRNKLPLNFALAVLFFVGGFEFFCFWLFNTERFEGLFFTVYYEIANSYLIGPAFYLYFCLALGFRNRIRRIDLLHLIPYILSLAGIIVFRAVFPGRVIPVSGFPDYSVNLFLYLLAMFSDVSVGLYILITLIRAFILFRGENPKRELKLVLVFLLLLISGSAVLIAGGVSDSAAVLILGICFFTVMPSFYILFSFRHPEFAMQVLTEARQLHKNKSVLNHLDVELLLSELNILMAEKKLYTEEKLSLRSLSSFLDITPHQLSRLLNEYAGCSFNSYVNSHRVAEAKRLLCEYPKMGILQISMAVGFNSRSSFYTAFQKETGSIPAEFRKKTCPEL